MTHHKRRRPKNRRAGCLLCKSWKVNGVRTEALDGERFSDHRRREFARLEAESWGCNEPDELDGWLSLTDESLVEIWGNDEDYEAYDENQD